MWYALKHQPTNTLYILLPLFNFSLAFTHLLKIFVYTVFFPLFWQSPLFGILHLSSFLFFLCLPSPFYPFIFMTFFFFPSYSFLPFSPFSIPFLYLFIFFFSNHSRIVSLSSNTALSFFLSFFGFLSSHTYPFHCLFLWFLSIPLFSYCPLFVLFTLFFSSLFPCFFFS